MISPSNKIFSLPVNTTRVKQPKNPGARCSMKCSARSSVDGGRIIYLVNTGKIQSLKLPTFWFETTPQGKFMLSVAFRQAKYYTDNLILLNKKIFLG